MPDSPARGPRRPGAGNRLHLSPKHRAVIETLLRRFGVLRVSAAEEARGLDLAEHGAGAYPADPMPRDERAYEQP